MRILFLLLALASFGSCFISKDMLKQAQRISENGILEVDDPRFDILFDGPKDYYLIVLFTATKVNAGCSACDAFGPMFKTVARSYVANYPDSKRVFFAEADFGDNREHFKQLQMNTVPHLWIYPPSELTESEIQAIEPADWKSIANVTSPHMVYRPPDKFITARDTDGGELHFAQFLSEVLHTNIVLQKPFDVAVFLQYFSITFAVVFALKKRGQRIWGRLQKYYLYCFLSILSILISVSGFNFSTQRQVPFLARNDKGQIMYLSGGTHYQFGSEMLISAGFYVLLGVTTVLLITWVPKLKDHTKRGLATLVLTGVLFVLYCMLGTVFHSKDSSYPYVPLSIPVF
ncbi:unnamed protein product [Kuraishia capsulata CBS 1993]|uniref:Thioredoxin domain-containing protein n=1 Tax=Kuraishia capsulata CBS 1993 TaxID=1382522 RepID=W6MM71_9ASCO|nr:uncharacterized protein KUCA_T00003271001 [Kuraishia capsulata CBS 1993]CDK27293.1 unnamed protein product [Kuraishia capsulata CBS 1993]